MNKLISNALGYLVLSLSFFATQSLAEVVDTIEKSFAVQPQSEFTLANINGEVVLSSWAENTIKVVAKIRADDQKSFDRVVVEMKQKDNHVFVETEYKKESFFSKNNDNTDVDYDVLLPESIAVTHVDLVNGSLQLKNINGDINTDLVNGSTKGSGLSGNGNFNGVNGSIDISYVALNEKIDTIEIDTVNGGIKLTLPNNVNAKIKAETMNGSIKNEFGLTSDKQTFLHKALDGILGNGHTLIIMDSVNGGINILRSQ